MIDNLNDDQKKRFAILGHIVKFSDIFRVTLIVANLFLLYRNNELNKEVDRLRRSNIYLTTQNILNLKAINESPLVWWKKEIFKDGEIIMRDYNDAFYYYFLKPLNYGRYYYINKRDDEVFNSYAAKNFYDEDIELYREFIQQPVNEHNGTRDRMIKSYDEEWTDLRGNINDDGYWRYIREEEGHIYIYGTLKEPIVYGKKEDKK